MKHQKIQALIFWCDRKMSGMILNFDGNEINQKEFETYKKQIGIPSANINKMVISDRFKNSNKSVKYVILSRFQENKGRIKSIGLYGWFQWYFKYWLGRRSYKDDRIIARWKEIVSIFKDKLVKMIKDVAGKFHDYSISSMIRQVLLHWD